MSVSGNYSHPYNPCRCSLCQPHGLNWSWGPAQPKSLPSRAVEGYYRGWRVWRTADIEAQVRPYIWYPRIGVKPNFQKGILHSWFYPSRWHPGINHAEGMTKTAGGFYVNTDVKRLFAQLDTEFLESNYSYDSIMQRIASARSRWMPLFKGGDIVIGTTLCFGQGVVATEGARFTIAVPEYIVATGVFDTDRVLDETAMRYGMRLVSLGHAARVPTGIVEEPAPAWVGKALLKEF